MPYTHVDALLEFDPAHQSVIQPFYLASIPKRSRRESHLTVPSFLDDHNEVLNELQKIADENNSRVRMGMARALLMSHPTSALVLMNLAAMSSDPNFTLACVLALRETATEVMKRTPLKILDPQIATSLACVGVEELINALIELRRYDDVIGVVESHRSRMPDYEPWFCMTLLVRSAVAAGHDDLFSKAQTRFLAYATKHPAYLPALLLAEIVNTYVNKGQCNELTLLVDRFNKVPRTPQILEDIRVFTMDVPDLPAVLAGDIGPTDDERAKELSILASSLTGDQREECLALAREQYPNSMWTWLSLVYAAKHAREQLLYAEQGLTFAGAQDADRSDTPYVDLLAGKGRALFALDRYDEALTTFEQLFILQTDDVTEMYESYIALVLAKGPQEFDRALMLINDAREIGNYYPALPWLELLIHLHQRAPSDIIDRTLSESLRHLPWVGLMIAGYHPMASSRDPGPPTDLDEPLLTISFNIVQHAYAHFPTVIKQLRTLLR